MASGHDACVAWCAIVITFLLDRFRIRRRLKSRLRRISCEAISDFYCRDASQRQLTEKPKVIAYAALP